MKKLFILFLAVLSLGLMGMGSPFPGDGYDNPDAEGVSGHGPALKYTDNGDGTFTDKVTKFMWEKKDSDDSTQDFTNPHDVDNTYDWTAGTTAPTGTLWDFLDTLNETCEGEDVTVCESHKDCAKGEKCGFAGHTDWCIPNIKRLQSIVDYRVFNPSSMLPGATRPFDYWSSTTDTNANFAWKVDFRNGSVLVPLKTSSLFARAVRPCS